MIATRFPLPPGHQPDEFNQIAGMSMPSAIWSQRGGYFSFPGIFVSPPAPASAHQRISASAHQSAPARQLTNAHHLTSLPTLTNSPRTRPPLLTNCLRIPNAIAGRDSLDLKIAGMQGVPKEFIEQHIVMGGKSLTEPALVLNWSRRKRCARTLRVQL